MPGALPGGVLLLNPPNGPWKIITTSLFRRSNQAQRGGVFCPRAHSSEEAKAGLEPPVGLTQPCFVAEDLAHCVSLPFSWFFHQLLSLFLGLGAQ